jgi:apolipoprotein N-acyltransferase
MASANNIRRIPLAMLVIALTGVLFWFGNGLDPWWPLLWFAPLPVLVFALRGSWWSVATTATLSWLAGCLNMWHYLSALQLPSLWVLMFLAPALVFAAAVLLFRALLRRGAQWSALLVLPAAWVSFEYVRGIFWPHGTAASLAYTQLNFLPVLQLASLTGLWGITFLLLLFPAALAIGLHLRDKQPKQALRIVSASLGVIVLVLLFGAVRLALPLPRQQVSVGLIASDSRENAYPAASGAKTERLFHDYAAEAERLASRGAQVIVLPEKIGTLADPDTASADAIFQSVAGKTGSTIVAGVIHKASPVEYNQARIYAPDTPVQSYDKRHLLLPYESNFQPGTELTLIRKPSETWGVGICKDMDFTPLSRQYGKAGVGLMLDPGWDFNMDRSWHGHIAIMRGVEDGFSVAHAAKNGYLTVSDDRGRILAQTRSDSAPFATLVAQVPAAHNATPYVMWGDWFAWLALAIFVCTLIQFFRLRQNLQA